MAGQKQVHARITGRVQGVCFRMETQRTAHAHGVSGWVKNMPDGSVEALIEGPSDRVDAVLAWCRQGPMFSVVSSVNVEERPFSGEYSSFDITH